MKTLRFTLLFCLLIGFTQTIKAEKISLEQATYVAKQQQKRISENNRPVELVHVAKNSTDAILYYIFNVAEDNGFIIVAGNDAVMPIIGYSTEGNFNTEQMPPNFAAWMDEIARSIETTFDNPSFSNEKAFEKWEELLNENSRKRGVVVEPFITTKWGRNEPYHNLCPLYQGERTASGCVARCMAQIMNYYEYPEKGTGITPSYYTRSLNILIPEVDLSETEYQWDLMLDEYDDNSPEESNTAVAQLIYNASVSVLMDFGVTGSGAYSYNVAIAMPQYFNYDNSLQLRQRYNYDTDQWNNAIRHELDEGRPVYYAAYEPNVSGHAFLLDGYDSDELFHINWGWDGNFNGYFSLDDFHVDTHNYSHGHEIIIGFKPNEGGINLPPASLFLFEDSDLYASTSSVNINEPFSVEAQFINHGPYDFNGYIGIALVDEADNILEVIAIEEFPYVLPVNSYMGWPYIFECVVSGNVPSGNYFIRAIARQENGEWMVVRNISEHIDRLPLQLKTIGIEETNLEKITIYPNPNNGIIYIENHDLVIRKVKVYDILGGNVKTFESIENQLNITDLHRGIYFLQITTNQGIVMEKIVKQ